VSLFEDLGFSPEERYHLASDDYEELWDAILEHPSPEKAVDGDPYLRYRPRYRHRTASADTDLSGSTTGDSGQRHTDLNATPGPVPQVDFIPFEEGTKCSYCNERPAECTVNGANLCLEDAQNRWGVDIAQAAKANGVEDMLSSGHDTPLDEQLAEEDGPDFSEPHTAMAQYQGDHFFIFHKANPRSMGGSPLHVMEAWDQESPLAHQHPTERGPGSTRIENMPVGRLYWNHRTGEIHNVDVHPGSQRQGLATELLRRARDVAANTRGVKPPRHSSNRTISGEEWARSLNERLPRRTVEARWVDVREKAKRLRADKAVHLLEVPSPDSPYVFAEVQGDTALHHCFVAVKGDEQGQWSCSCNWGDFGPNGPLAADRSPTSPYKRTPCSHVLATRWELQSRSMFGRNPYTGALKEGSMDIFDEWFAGRFLVEARETPQYPRTRLAPHPNIEGTPLPTQTRPGTYKRNDRATHFEDMDPEHQRVVREHFANNFKDENGDPLTHERMVQNVKDMYHDAAQSDYFEGSHYLDHGAKWYHTAHKQVKQWANKYGIKPLHMAAATAALSPSTDWDSNLTMSHYFARHLGKNREAGHEKLDLDPSKFDDKQMAAWHKVPDLDKNGRPPRGNPERLTHAQIAERHGLTHGRAFDDMDDREAAHALHLQQKYTHNVKKDFGGDMVEHPTYGSSWQSADNAEKAVGIMRGKHPDKLLSGSKVRSFFNNLWHPGKTDDVTIDSHAASMIVGAKMGASSDALKTALDFRGAKKETLPQRTSMEEEHNVNGGYAYMASALRKAHADLVASGHMSKNSTPADLQAVTWKRWRDRNPGGGAIPKEEKTPSLYTPKDIHPILSHMVDNEDHHDHFHDDDWASSLDDEPGYDEADHDEDDPDDLLDPYGGPDEPDPDLYTELPNDGRPLEDDGDEEDQGTPYSDVAELEDLPYERHKEGAMYDWTKALRQERRQVLAAQVSPPPPPPVVPVQYLGQVPHHLASGMDEFGFEPHQAIAVPSEQWQAQHSPGAHNPASTAPPGFGDPLDPLDQRDMLGSPYPDEKLLEPGPTITSPIRSPGFSSGYEVFLGHQVAQAQGGGGGGGYVAAPLNPQPPFPMVQAPNVQPQSGPLVPEEPPGASQVLAEHQAGLEWLRPPGGASDGLTGTSPGMSREALVAAHRHESAELASAADAFLRTGSVPAPGFEVNMDTILAMPPGSLSGMGHDARSRDFTPAEQDEMVREGELEGARASNLHMLRLEGSMYEELERQLAGEDQSRDAATALFW
jgi:GNAT superfamily N-acetyltransferase